MQAELERTAEEEAEHRAKQKEKAQARSDDLAALFGTQSTAPSSTDANSADTNAQQKVKAVKPGKPTK